MNINLAKDVVSGHLRSSHSNLMILKVDEGKGEILLSSQDDSFTCCLSCPASEQESWGLWSESPASLPIVQLALDLCDLQSCSVSSLLEAIEKAIKMTLQTDVMHNDKDESNSDCDDEEEDENDYYAPDESDEGEAEAIAKQFEEREVEKRLTASFYTGKGSESAVKRLVKDLRTLDCSTTTSGIEAAPFEDDLFVWHVRFTDIPPDTKLGKDLMKFSKRYDEKPVIKLEMQFPPDYPFSPPFIRVLKPRFKFMTGHVTLGGSICMQMLTKSGWQPTNDIESILVQVRAQILSDPNASLDDHQPNTPYPEEEARKAFERLVLKHGW